MRRKMSRDSLLIKIYVVIGHTCDIMIMILWFRSLWVLGSCIKRVKWRDEFSDNTLLIVWDVWLYKFCVLTIVSFYGFLCFQSFLRSLNLIWLYKEENEYKTVFFNKDLCGHRSYMRHKCFDSKVHESLGVASRELVLFRKEWCVQDEVSLDLIFEDKITSEVLQKDFQNLVYT